MSAAQDHPLWPWVAASLASMAGVIVAVSIVRCYHKAVSAADSRTLHVRIDDPAELGVTATITAGGTTVHARLPRMTIDVGVGESLDARLPEGRFEADCTVVFRAGAVHEASIGAEIQGGSVIILHEGRLLLTEYAGAEPRVRLTSDLESFGTGHQRLQFIFRGDGDKPARMRALWKPLGADQPSPLPSEPAVIPAR